MSKIKTNWDALVDSDGNYYNPNIGGGGTGPGGTGPAGPQGPIGPTGAQGPQGLQGQKGETGLAPVLSFQGSVANSTTALTALSATSSAGDTYFITDGSNEYWAYDGTTWNNTGSAIKGEIGQKGDAGLQGPTGAQGPIGATGLQGPAGAASTKGDTGPAGPAGPAGTAGAAGPAGPQGTAGVGTVGPIGPIGPAGTAGTNGTNGTDGADGAKGEPGVAGAASAKGDVGPQGPAGVTGPAGIAGPTGLTGANGPQGVAGAVGPTGPQGVTGPAGPTGQKGEVGLVGDKGEEGAPSPLLTYAGSVATVVDRDAIDTTSFTGGETVYVDATGLYYTWDTGTSTWSSGAQAVKGEIGLKGPKGDTGLAGTDGLDGATGATGAVGPAGPTGAQGAQGVAGTDGTDGVQGLQGPIGISGADGDKGVEGDKGEAGQAAPLLEYQGSVPTVGSLPADNPVGSNTAGDTYYVDDGNGLYYSWDDNTASWISAGQAVKGDLGTQGPAGNDGADGVDGTQGPAGLTGPAGVAGPQGIQGIQGDKGAEGEKGPKGDKLLYSELTAAEKLEIKGQKGELGTSPYEMAVDNGFVGTEPEWLESLKGDEGDQGLEGFRGDKGQRVAGAVTAHASFVANGAVGLIQPADIKASYYVDAINHTGTGTYTITWEQQEDPTNPGTFIDLFDTADGYSVLLTCGYSGVGPSTSFNAVVVSQSTGSCDIIVERSDNGNQSDVDKLNIVAYGAGTDGVILTLKGDAAGPIGDKGQRGEKGVVGDKGLIPAGAVTGHATIDGGTGAAFNWTTDTPSYYNISSISRLDVGKYEITWASGFASDAYTVVGSAGAVDHAGSARTVSVIARTATTLTIVCERSDNGDNIDSNGISIVAYGPGDSGINSTIKGEKGPQGPSTIAVGTTTTVLHPASATVTNSGTLVDAVLDFEVPAGEKGERQFQAAGAVTAHATFVATAALANGVLAAGDIKSSYGIDSIEKIRDGEFTVTFTNAFTAADNYSAIGTAHGDYGATIGGSTRVVLFNTFTANSVLCEIEESNGDRASADTVSVVFYGDASTGEKLDYKGDKGEIGPSGGEKGDIATIAIGTTVSVASQFADVTNSGTPQSAILDFQLPKGADGPQGEKGENGAAVDKGDKGEKGVEGADGIGSGVKLSFASWDASGGSGYSWGADQGDSYNISSVNRTQSGRYEIFFSSNYSNANYAMWAYTYTTGDSLIGSVNVISRSSGSMIVETKNMNGTIEDTNEYICVQVMGI